MTCDACPGRRPLGLPVGCLRSADEKKHTKAMKTREETTNTKKNAMAMQTTTTTAKTLWFNDAFPSDLRRQIRRKAQYTLHRASIRSL